MNRGMLICSFSLKKRYKNDENLICLNDVYECKVNNNTKIYENIISMLDGFCKHYKSYSDDEDLQKMFLVDNKSIKKYNDETSNSMSFIICSGSYGIEAEMTDRNTKKINYRWNKDDADIKRFICYVYVPKDKADIKIKKGIIIFQSIAKYGIKTITNNYMRDYFSKIGLTFEVKSVSPTAFFDNLIEKGEIKKLTITRNLVSKNIADNLFIEKGKVKTSYTNPVFKNDGIRKIKSLFAKKSENSKIELSEILDKDIEDISLCFSLGGRSRTVRLAALDKLSIIEEIPKTITTEEQIVNYMKNTAKSYKEHLICY